MISFFLCFLLFILLSFKFNFIIELFKFKSKNKINKIQALEFVNHYSNIWYSPNQNRIRSLCLCVFIISKNKLYENKKKHYHHTNILRMKLNCLRTNMNRVYVWFASIWNKKYFNIYILYILLFEIIYYNLCVFQMQAHAY